MNSQIVSTLTPEEKRNSLRNKATKRRSTKMTYLLDPSIYEKFVSLTAKDEENILKRIRSLFHKMSSIPNMAELNDASKLTELYTQWFGSSSSSSTSKPQNISTTLALPKRGTMKKKVFSKLRENYLQSHEDVYLFWRESVTLGLNACLRHLQRLLPHQPSTTDTTTTSSVLLLLDSSIQHGLGVNYIRRTVSMLHQNGWNTVMMSIHGLVQAANSPLAAIQWKKFRNLSCLLFVHQTDRGPVVPNAQLTDLLAFCNALKADACPVENCSLFHSSRTQQGIPQ